MRSCGAISPDGFLCTVEHGHPGRHEAWGTERMFEAWPLDRFGRTQTLFYRDMTWNQYANAVGLMEDAGWSVRQVSPVVRGDILQFVVVYEREAS